MQTEFRKQQSRLQSTKFNDQRHSEQSTTLTNYIKKDWELIE